MTKEVEMSTKYDPSQVEPGRYKEWIEKGLFKPNEDKEAKPYSIVNFFMHTKSGRRRNRPPFCCAALLFETAGDRLNFGIKRQYLNEIKSMSGFNRKSGFCG